MGSCSGLHSKMMQFCSTEKYCDVQVRVQGKSFPCHRVVLAAASEYFDALFGGSFMEKDARETVLHDIDAGTFKDVLECVYTEKMCKITASNVLNLLSASSYLMIHSLEEACTKYIRNNVRSLRDQHTRIFVLARSSNVTALIDFITEYVLVNFRLFYNDDTLLEMTFDDLSFLLSRWSEKKTPFKYEDLLLHFLIRWVHRASKERREYFVKLIAAVDFERISPNNVTFMMQYCKDFIGQPGLEGMPPLNLPPVFEESKSTSGLLVRSWHDDTEDSKKRLCLKRKLSAYLAGDGEFLANYGEEIRESCHDPTFYKNVYGLNLYVEYNGSDSCRSRTSFKVLSSNKHYPDWFVSCETDAWRSCTDRRTVVQESTNLLFCMEIYQDENSFADHRQTFCTYSSIDLKLASSVLTSPPVHLEQGHFNMCATFQNDIYLLSFPKHKFRDLDRSKYDLLMSVEEITIGFYRYNCELDKWFSAPIMESYQNLPSVCADNNLIYLIGGTSLHDICSKTFQALDYRSGKWMRLPTCIADCHDHYKSSSCVLQNKVFVSNGPSYIHSYDTVAGKWESIRPAVQFGAGQKMVSYDNKLWLLYTVTKLKGDHLLTSYSPDTQEWYHYKGFHDVISRSGPSRTDGNLKYDFNIKDMISF